jgi:hypothetical protein
LVPVALAAMTLLSDLVTQAILQFSVSFIPKVVGVVDVVSRHPKR